MDQTLINHRIAIGCGDRTNHALRELCITQTVHYANCASREPCRQIPESRKPPKQRLQTLLNLSNIANYGDVEGDAEGDDIAPEGDDIAPEGDSDGEAPLPESPPPPQAAKVAVKPRIRSKPIAVLFIFFPLVNCKNISVR